jgi:hypothetical protein
MVEVRVLPERAQLNSSQFVWPMPSLVPVASDRGVEVGTRRALADSQDRGLTFNGMVSEA